MSSAPPRWSPQAKRSSEVTPPERRAPGKNVKLTMAVVEGDHTKKLARPPNGKKESSTKPKVGSHYVHGDHGGARGASFTVPKRRLSLPFAGAEAAAATAASLIEVVKDVPLTLAEEETLRVKFNEFDLNGDGSLDASEVIHVLKQMTGDDAVDEEAAVTAIEQIKDTARQSLVVAADVAGVELVDKSESPAANGASSQTVSFDEFKAWFAQSEFFEAKAKEQKAIAAEAEAKDEEEGISLAWPADASPSRAGKGCENPNFKGSYLGRFPLVSADFWTRDHLSERSRP